MTDKHSSAIRTKKAIFICCVGFFFALTFKNSYVVINYMRIGLRMCANTLIPSLFPFMVISELLVSSGLGELISKAFSAPMKKIFGLSSNGCCAALLGALCGFPIGAKTAISLYDKGVISKSEVEHLLTFSNNPSSAFLINAVGISLFGNSRIGFLIYLCVLFSGLIIGFLAKFFIDSKTDFCSKTYDLKREVGYISLFTSAVSNAVSGMLTVCAFVLLFTVINGCIDAFFQTRFNIVNSLRAIVFGFIEISGGISAAACVESLPCAVVIAALISGWSGLCVHFQIISICSGRSISFKPYFIAKLFQGLLSAVICAIALLIFPNITATASQTTDVDLTVYNPKEYIFIATLFFFCVVCTCFVSIFKKKARIKS